jgi:hypothetical protein
MKLSAEEELFLRHWMYDEVHYRERRGPAKMLQVERNVAPADLGALIAASMPEPKQQETAGVGPPPSTLPIWPWTGETLAERVAEAQTILRQRGPYVSAGMIYTLKSDTDLNITGDPDCQAHS